MIRPMIRKTALGLTTVATIAMAMATTGSTASAGVNVHFHFGAPAYGYGYSHGYPAPYGYGYGAPAVSYHSCPRVFVGYRSVHTRWGWKNKPIYKRRCRY